MADNERVTLDHAPRERRYEVRVDGQLAGFARYTEPDREHVDFVHTEVGDDYAGRGLAGRLVAYAVADVRERGLRIIPHCPFVQAWLRKHTEYDGIVDWPAAH